jgi:hypothetical protein
MLGGGVEVGKLRSTVILNAETGKTCFLYYLLLLLLSQETPVAFQPRFTVLIFSDCGVDLHRPETDAFPNGTWALCRSHKGTEKPCDPFLDASRQDRAWIVQTTAPLEKRWIKWQRHEYIDIFVMDHPSVKEIAVLGFVSLRRAFLVCLLNPFP